MGKAQGYQLDFSASYADEMYDRTARAAKAEKSLSILADHLADTSGLRLLDIGCSTGFMTSLYAERFRSTLGIDIDEPAVQFAREHAAVSATDGEPPRLDFRVADSMATGLPGDSFDVVTCTHIYEHVPDSQRLVDEIYRVLKPGGACLLAAGNRYMAVEAHYKLPLLAAVPKWVGHRYLRLAGKGDHYYETHLSLRGLRRLVRRFEVIDYTRRVIEEPERFAATDMLVPGSMKHRVALALVRRAYWLVPTYLWVLKKPGTPA